MNSLVFHQGKSNLGGKDIFVVATNLNRKSSNPKTGDMVQTWILRSDRSPTKAVVEGTDTSVCGNCPAKFTNKDYCYVKVFYAPANVWAAYQRKAYDFCDEIPGDKPLRLGSYGDPAAVPYKTWKNLIRSRRWTAYTHQWMVKGISTKYKHFCMASCDDESDREKAKKKGYRTFRIKGPDDPVLPGEVVCSASEEAGKRVTCEQCCLCAGTRFVKWKDKTDVVINAHGVLKGKYA